MTPRIIGVLTFVVVAVGVAVGVYFAGQVSDGSTAAQEQNEKPRATPTAVVVESPLPDLSTATPMPTPSEEPPPVTPPPIPYEELPLYVTPRTPEEELARVEEMLARLAEECREKGISPPPITPDDSPATPPWLVTPTVRDPVKQLRDALNRASPSQKLVISEDIVVLKLFSVFPEDLDPDRFDPAKFGQDNIGYTVYHVSSLSGIGLDRQGREIRRNVSPSGTTPGEEGLAQLENVLTDPATFAMIREFVAQPLDPCEVFSGLRNSLPEVCLTTKE